MKKIIFKRLTIKNFLSVGNVPVIIDFKPGLHAITGINRDQIDRRNGVGKSTIPDALHFALFGTTIRELKKEFILNNITENTCEVSLAFSIHKGKTQDNYEIVRSIEPSRCTLYHNDRDITRDSIANTTLYIEELIQSTSDIFQNCVIMTINNTIPFMAKKKNDKRKFIESIFNLEIFSKMLTQLREEQNSHKRNLEAESARQDELSLSHETLVTQQTKAHEDYQTRKKTLEERQINNNKELLAIEKRIEKFKPINIDEINKNITLLNDKLKETDVKIQDLGKQVASLETKNEFLFTTMAKIGTKEDVCPTCLRSIEKNDLNHIHETKAKYQTEVAAHETEIKLLEAKIFELNTLKTKILDAVKKGQGNLQQNELLAQQNNHDTKRKDQLVQYNEQVSQDLQHLTDTSISLNEAISQSKLKLDQIQDSVKKLQQILNLLDTVKFVVSEEGVKSFIVKKILRLFNSKLAYYLKKLNSNAIITFNEYFEEQIFNEKGKLTTYFNFSGAERKAIDLAIMFSFIDMLNLQGNIFYNIQFYDELLDTSLDETGVELVLSLLNEFVHKNNFGVYIISHRKECAKFVTGDMIILEKVNGLTTLSKSVPS